MRTILAEIQHFFLGDCFYWCTLYITHTTFYSTAPYASILYRFRVIASYLSTVADPYLPHLHLNFEFRRHL